MGKEMKNTVSCDEKMGQTYIWEEQANTLASRDYKDPQRVAYSFDRGGTDMNDNDQEEYIVRRLTPKECARLQGFPDDWCDDVPHSDSAEYKLWGNGIALPSILGIMQNCVRMLDGDL